MSETWTYIFAIVESETNKVIAFQNDEPKEVPEGYYLVEGKFTGESGPGPWFMDPKTRNIEERPDEVAVMSALKLELIDLYMAKSAITAAEQDAQDSGLRLDFTDEKAIVNEKILAAHETALEKVKVDEGALAQAMTAVAATLGVKR